MLQTARSRSTCQSRAGMATVEFALTVPVLLLLVFAGIEFSRANVLINTAKVAASEGARRGIVVGTTEADIRAAAQNELSMIGIAHSDIVVEPAVITDDTQLITVGVSVPLDHRNGYVIPRWFVGNHVSKITSIPREAVNDPNMSDRLASSFADVKQKLKKKAEESKKDEDKKDKDKEKKEKKADDD